MSQKRKDKFELISRSDDLVPQASLEILSLAPQVLLVLPENVELMDFLVFQDLQVLLAFQLTTFTDNLVPPVLLVFLD